MHLDNAGHLITGKMVGVLCWQFDAGKQPVIQGGGHQLVALLLHLSQERLRGPFQDALHASFWRAAASALPRHPHQHTIAIPGVVQLMVTDVDVFAAVIANGEAEAFAAATQAGINQITLLGPCESTLTRLLDHPRFSSVMKRQAQAPLYLSCC